MIETLQNDKISVSFDTSSCSIVSIKNKVSGDDYIKTKDTTQIFSLACLDENREKTNLYPISATVIENGNEQSLDISFDVDNNIYVKASLQIEDDSDKIEWNIGVENKGELDIVEVLYPRIRGMYLGDTYKDDTIIYPHHAGEKTLNPIEEYLKPCFTDIWRAGTKNDGDVNYRELNYCGLASMMWMYYYDVENGFYISSYDDDFLLTGLRVEIGDKDNPWIGFAFRKYTMIKKDMKWNSKPYVISVNCEDWHYGAREYRKWINNYIKMPQNPGYLKNEYALMNMYHFKREGKVYYKFKDIPQLFDTAKSYGINHFFMAGWNRQGFDQNYPEYYPDMDLGTSMDLYNGCKYVHEKGGVSTAYINARIFDTKSDYFEGLGKKMAIKLHDDSMVNEQYGKYKFTVSCPSDKLWQRYIIDTAYWMAKSYNIKGIYLDQLGSAEPFPCYDRNHSHEDIGLFNKGYLDVLSELKESLKELDKDTFLMIENCGDIYGSYTWGNLTWNEGIKDEYFNIYKYTFPEYVQVNMINPKTVDDKDIRQAKYYEDIERALVLGSVLWCNPVTKFNDDEEEMLLYLRKAIHFRKLINPNIIKSKFVDTEGIDYISDGIKVTRWISCDGEELYIIGNNRGTGGCFDISGDAMDIRMCTINNGYITPQYKNVDRKIRITVPDDKVAFLIIRKGETL